MSVREASIYFVGGERPGHERLVVQSKDGDWAACRCGYRSPTFTGPLSVLRAEVAAGVHALSVGVGLVDDGQEVDG